MKNILCLCSFVMVAVLTVSCSSGGDEAGLEWNDGWVRAMPPNSGMTAAYGEIRNNSHHAMDLTGFSSDSFDSVSLHQSRMENGVSSMSEFGEFTLQPGESLVLEPGGLHLMLMQAKHNVAAGDQVQISVNDGRAEHLFTLPVQAR